MPSTRGAPGRAVIAVILALNKASELRKGEVTHGEVGMRPHVGDVAHGVL